MLSFSLLLKITAFFSFIYLYQEGGQGHRWTKKWLAPIVIGLISLILAKHFSYFILIGSLGSLGAANGFSYGEKFTQNILWKKILFRGLCGASYGLCGLLIGIGTGHILLGMIQLVLATLGSILFGVLNPFPDSWGNWKTRVEDICISSLYIFLLFFMI